MTLTTHFSGATLTNDLHSDFTVTEAAAYLNTSRRSIYRLLEAGRLERCAASDRIPMIEVEFEARFKALNISRPVFDEFMFLLYNIPEDVSQAKGASSSHHPSLTAVAFRVLYRTLCDSATGLYEFMDFLYYSMEDPITDFPVGFYDKMREYCKLPF